MPPLRNNSEKNQRKNVFMLLNSTIMLPFIVKCGISALIVIMFMLYFSEDDLSHSLTWFSDEMEAFVRQMKNKVYYKVKCSLKTVFNFISMVFQWTSGILPIPTSVVESKAMHLFSLLQKKLRKL